MKAVRSAVSETVAVVFVLVVTVFLAPFVLVLFSVDDASSVLPLPVFASVVQEVAVVQVLLVPRVAFAFVAVAGEFVLVVVVAAAPVVLSVSAAVAVDVEVAAVVAAAVEFEFVAAVGIGDVAVAALEAAVVEVVVAEAAADEDVVG